MKDGVTASHLSLARRLYFITLLVTRGGIKRRIMSGLKNSPFGKRLRASNQDADEAAHKRNRHRIKQHPQHLDYSSRATGGGGGGGPDSPVDFPRVPRDYYGDRFVPSRDTGDMRTSYHLMDEGGPSTPSKNRLIPCESDALRGRRFIDTRRACSRILTC